MLDEARVLSLLKQLIATNSENPPGYEKEVAKVLREHMEAHGLSAISVGSNERPNLIFSSHEGEKGQLLLHGHMDTVPIGDKSSWSFDPFGSEISNGRLYGRGACDMKGPLAAIAETLIQYSEEGHKEPLVMLATSDEESGCSGAEEVVKSRILEGISFGVCCEPTSLDVLIGEKGIFWSKVSAQGKAAHGSRPEEGVNAIEKCIQALDILKNKDYHFEENAILGKPTINISVIKGGIKINVVPDACEALIDMRIVKGQTPEVLLELMKSAIDSAGLSGNISVEYVHGKPAVLTPPDAEIVKVSMNIVEQVTGKRSAPVSATFGTDCSVIQPKIGILNVICGPGSIKQAHQPDEYISVEQLFQSVEVYGRIAEYFAA